MRAMPSVAALPLMCSLSVAVAFDGHRVTEGPLALSIKPPPTVTDYDQPVPVRVRLENHDKAVLTGVAEVRNLVDDWRVVGRARQPFSLKDGQAATLTFCVAAGKETYAELYPIHVYARFRDGQQERTAHAVRIIEPKLQRPDASLKTPPSVPVTSVPVRGAFPLWSTHGPARKAAIRRITEALGGLATGPPPPGQILRIDRSILGNVRLPVRHGYVLGLGPDGDRCAVLVQPGRRGLIDGLIGLGYADGKTIVFDGLPVQINGSAVGEWTSTVAYERCDRRISEGRLTAVHRLGDRLGAFDLTISLWSDGPGLRIKFDCAGDPAGKTDPADPRRITDLSLGPANVKASRVYYGHGYCIENPKGFGAHFGGHNMSASHVGFDFESGIALLQAVDNPPDRLEVRPDQRRYQLHTHMNATLTLVASKKGAFDCAIQYRELYDKPAAGGVRRLAGRFTYDIWWSGPFADIAKQMARQIRYGCTDAILTLHVWQRWGYDYRLPDIFPPNPRLGTVEDLRQIGELCRKHDIPWGLHDNYTDFYPDATGYTYDHVCFGRDGTPRKAWCNVGRRAQSYRWRPDRFMPFLQRNLKRIKPALDPSHYFIDVLSSIGCYDFYDRQGGFHPKLETRRRWGEAFAWVRDYLGDAAPTTSEAGHDQLVGYLDGADCQFLTLSTIPRPTRFMITMRCEDWERTPWYDAVLHDKFILHGVGYCNRYRAGRPRELHGISSNDYISAEVLTGHPAMVDARCWGAAAVRKYWLLQDIARNLALRRIRSVTFADDNIHRQHVTWDNGTRVWVNRGQSDWIVHGHVLPQYGYLVEGKDLFSTIERRDGVIVEHTGGPAGVYCNARPLGGDRTVNVRLKPPAPGAESEEPRINLEKRRIDFGPLITDGACRVQGIKGGVRITPLPDSPPCSVRLRPWKSGHDRPVAGATMAALDEAGQTVRLTSVPATDGDVSLTHDGKAFCYEVRWKPAR